jgi:hypothetical protein
MMHLLATFCFLKFHCQLKYHHGLNIISSVSNFGTNFFYVLNARQLGGENILVLHQNQSTVQFTLNKMVAEEWPTIDRCGDHSNGTQCFAAPLPGSFHVCVVVLCCLLFFSQCVCWFVNCNDRWSVW